MDRILIFGNGQMGNFLLTFFQGHGYEVEVTKCDVTDFSAVQGEITAYRPTVAINTAAKTNLEWCADHKAEAINVNVLGADNIARACDEAGVYFIHFSSGCIFESRGADDAKREEDVPHPISFYAFTKVWAEELIGFKKSPDFQCLTLRLRQPVSAAVSSKNMLVKMLTFTRFIDVPNTATVIEDLMEWMEVLIRERVTGTIHVANEGTLTPYNIGILLRKHILPSLPVEKISKEALNRLTPEARVDTILNVDRLKAIVGTVKPLPQRLEEIIVQLGKNLKEMDPAQVRAVLEQTAAQSATRTIVNECWKELVRE